MTEIKFKQNGRTITIEIDNKKHSVTLADKPEREKVKDTLEKFNKKNSKTGAKAIKKYFGLDIPLDKENDVKFKKESKSKAKSKTKSDKNKNQISLKQASATLIVVIDGETHKKTIKDKEIRDKVKEDVKAYNEKNTKTKLNEIIKALKPNTKKKAEVKKKSEEVENKASKNQKNAKDDSKVSDRRASNSKAIQDSVSKHKKKEAPKKTNRRSGREY